MPADSGDIRRWFLKQPHKKDHGNAEEHKPFLDAAKGSPDARPDLKKTSKYFSSTGGAKTAVNEPKSVAKKPATPEPKPSPEKSPAKRKQQNADLIIETKIESPAKKARVTQKPGALHHRLTDGDNDDDLGDSDFDDGDGGVKLSSSPSAGRGRGRGRGRGTGGRSVTASAPEESGPKPAGRGRGGGGRGGGAYQPRAPPPHKGEKEVPEGAEGCLSGLTFVISGTLDSLEREEAEDLIKRHGGRVTSAVSKKTSFLLADEDIGGRKSDKAKELGVPFLTEDGLFDKIRSSKPASVKTEQRTPGGQGHKEETAKAELVTPKSIAAKAKAPASPLSMVQRRGLSVETKAWPQKYQPVDASEIIGNQSIVKQLHDWLQHWEVNNLQGGQQKSKKRAGSSSSNTSKKAVLLSGPPGIGKTTSARLISKALGFEAFEVNASDNRGKADSKVGKGVCGSTANAIKEMVSNESLKASSDKNKGTKPRKAVLIMDEVDGMSGGDRGGVADLIASIKISKIPIMCICNDRYSQKLKSLVNYCLPLNFRRPTKQQMAKRLQQIAQAEGMEVDEIALEELAERVNGDMRMALNELQYMSLRTRVVKFKDIKARLGSGGKDEDISPFNAVDKLMSYDGGRLRMDERLDASMSDPDLVPLLIQENYLNYCPSLAGRDENGTARMDLVARAASCIADGDIVNVQIRQYRQWQHSQMAAFMSSIIPAALMHGRRETLVQGERNFNRFGGWLGKNSSFGKKLRLLDDLHVHLLASRVCEPTRQAVRRDYLYMLALQLTTPLKIMPKEKAVLEVVNFMEEYSITQEDFDSILELLRFQGQHDLMEGVQPAVKTALTKAYKQRESDRRVKSADLLPVFSPGGQKKAPKKRSALQIIPAESFEDEEVDESIDEDDEEIVDPDNLATLEANGKVQLILDENVAGKGKGKGSQARQANTRRKPSQKEGKSKPAKRQKEG